MKIKPFEDFLKETTGTVYVIDVQDDDEALDELEDLGIKDAKVVDKPRRSKIGGEGVLIRFTDTSDNDGMKWYLSGVGDEGGEPLAIKNKAVFNKFLKQYED